MDNPVQAPAARSTARITQPTTWGNPRRIRTPRFNRLMFKWLASLNRQLAYVAIGLTIVIIGLILYLAFGVTYYRTFASDGTQFSCEIKTYRGSTK